MRGTTPSSGMRSRHRTRARSFLLGLPLTFVRFSVILLVADFRARPVFASIVLIAPPLQPGTEFLALSLRAEGYTVFANTEASGTFSATLAENANRRMENAGVILQGMFAIAMDLMRDWRNTPGSLQVLPFLDQYLPIYGYIARHHEAAVLNGTMVPGEMGL